MYLWVSDGRLNTRETNDRTMHNVIGSAGSSFESPKDNYFKIN